MDKPVVSIVVPVYNVERYFRSCINSIINQSYNNIEILLIDDGSTDKSGELCDEFAKDDKRIRVIHQENQGLSGARNTGIDAAQGAYLFFVDSDDFLSNDAIKCLVETLSHYNADLVVCDHVRCDDNDMFESFEITQKDKKEEQIDENKRMKVFLTESRIKVVAWGKLYKRELFKNVRFPVGRYNEDNFTTYRIVHAAKIIVVTNYIGYVYRRSASSITQQKFKLKHWDDVEGKIEQLHFIEANYPSLVKYAQASIVYACNQVLFLMGSSGSNELTLIYQMKKFYRSYEAQYLKSSANISGKLFSLIAFVNPYFALYISKCIRNHV